MDLLKDLAKASGNELAGVVSDGIVAGDVDGYIDTGSYILNALVSGDIYRGIPSNKITALAGESATGKTFFALGMVQKFLEDNPEGNVVYFESESALTQEMLEDRGIDTSRILLVPVTTIEEFRTQAVNIIDGFDKQKKGDEKLFFVLDSLGMLSTIKETEDIGSGKNVRDMTKAQVIKGSQVILNPKILGFKTVAFIGVYLDKAIRNPDAVRKLRGIPEVIECHYTTGNWSIFAKLICRDNEHLMELLNKKIQPVDGVSRTETFISLQEQINRQIVL